MLAYRLIGEISGERKLILDVPDGVSPGFAEVVVLAPQSPEEIRELEDRIDAEAFRKAKEEPGEDLPWEDLKAEIRPDWCTRLSCPGEFSLNTDLLLWLKELML